MLDLELVERRLEARGGLLRLLPLALADEAHWPVGEVYDPATGGHWYYHRHCADLSEHGHFHLFLRRPGLPRGARPVRAGRAPARPAGAEALMHLVGIAIGCDGRLRRLFTTNQWVTGESFYPAATVVDGLARFAVSHDWPDPGLNQWLRAVIHRYADVIADLVGLRDRLLAEDGRFTAARLTDRRIEMVSEYHILPMA